MLVSILLPNYNHAHFLRQRIDSIMNQSFQDFELILMDDCSTDDSRTVIESYRAHPKVSRIVYNEQNSGTTFRQWNKGFGLAKGKYIWIAESDDYAAPEFLQRLVGVMEADDSVGLAYSQSYRADEAGALHGTWDPVYSRLDETLWQADFTADGKELVRRFMIFRNIVPNASAVLMRADVVKQLGPAPEHMRLAGDWLFWIRFMLQTRVAFVADPLNYFRFHNRNVRSKAELDGTILLETADVMQELIAQIRPEPAMFDVALDTFIEDWFRAYVYYGIPYSRHRAIFSKMAAVDPGFRKRFFRRISKLLRQNRMSGFKMLVGDKWLRRNQRR